MKLRRSSEVSNGAGSVKTPEESVENMSGDAANTSSNSSCLGAGHTSCQPESAMAPGSYELCFCGLQASDLFLQLASGGLTDGTAETS